MRGRVVGVAALAVVAGACGGQRQDADEPAGEFRVEVVRASFPAHQRIAESVAMRIRVRNADSRTAPDVAVSVETKPASAGRAPGAFGQVDPDPRLAAPQRPVWVLASGPRGGDTAQSGTWAVGALRPGETRELVWRLVAAKAGAYTVGYRLSPGLTGKARPAGGRTRGSFRVRISDRPVPATVNDRGEVVRGSEP